MDFSDFRNELDTKEHQERFFAGVPNIPTKAKEKMAIYQLFLQHIIAAQTGRQSRSRGTHRLHHRPKRNRAAYPQEAGGG